MPTLSLASRKLSLVILIKKLISVTSLVTSPNFDSSSSKMVHQRTQLVLCKIDSGQTVQTSLPKIKGSNFARPHTPPPGLPGFGGGKGNARGIVTSNIQIRKQSSNCKKFCSQSGTACLKNQLTSTKLWRNFKSDRRFVLQLGVDTSNILSDCGILNMTF